MSLHNDIMNLPVTKVMSEIGNIPDMILYKEGHRDARHAAAELAIEADNTIEELRIALSAILDGMEASGGWEGDEELFNKGMKALQRTF